MKAAAFGVALALLATPAIAYPLAGEIVVAGTTGPLAGVEARGAFTVDSAILTSGDAQMTSLDFTWNGIHYTQPLGSDVRGSVLGPDAFLVDFVKFIAIAPGGNEVALDYDLSLAGGDQQPAFFYLAPPFTPVFPDRFFFGFGRADLLPTPTPEPASLAILGVGLLGLVVARSRK